MNFIPNKNFNVIRGLQIFINDIRECTTKEAEAKRVDKELDKVKYKKCINWIWKRKKYIKNKGIKSRI